MNRSILTAISISLLTLGLTGCVSGLQGSTYSRSEARQVQEVEFGTVLSTNPVVIEGKQSGAGQLPGAIIGVALRAHPLAKAKANKSSRSLVLSAVRSSEA